MRQVYLAATGQNRGKTTASLGLFDLFLGRGLDAGFMKPVGQRTIIEDGVSADEDAVLMREVFGLTDPMPVMSPSTSRAASPRRTSTVTSSRTSARASGRLTGGWPSEHDIALIEGTGHAGVGAVIGLSNAVVAAMLEAPAVIVSEGGVGRPIDEIVLNASHFASHGVEVAGAIVNKVDLDEQPGLVKVLERGLAPYGIPLLGVLPYRPILSNPTLAMVLEGVRGETLHPGPGLDRVVDSVAIGAMEPAHMLERIGPGTLVIVPGDREDAILRLTAAHTAGEKAALGLVLTGGYRPSQTVIDEIRWADLFVTLVSEDTYEVASEVHDLLVKTHAGRRREDRADQGARRRVARRRPDPGRRPLSGGQARDANLGRYLRFISRIASSRPSAARRSGTSGLARSALRAFDPELVAAYDRLLAWSALGRGSIGALAWCWTDAEPAAFDRAPYVRQPHETQFGVTDHRGALRPRGQVLADLAATIRAIGNELDELAADGPLASAAIPVPHEYVRPYDAGGIRPRPRPGRTV